MRRPIKTRKDLEISSDHFLRRNPGYPFGVTFGELDYLRGHKCDFLGEQIPDEYDITDFVGVGSSIALVDGAHGGWVRLIAGPADTRYANLWLGDAANNYDTLDADEGWVQICRCRLSALTNVLFSPLAALTAGGHWLMIRYDSLIGANWVLQSAAGGATTTVNSGVAADTDWHWHVLTAYPITGGRQIDHYLDGALICSKTTDISNLPLTGFVRAYSRGAASRYIDLDFWAVIPRNL